MIVADSSVWIEVFLEGKYSDNFVEELRREENILIPSVVLFEVYKKIFREVDETSAMDAFLTMGKSKVIDLNRDLSLLAGQISVGENLGMADAIIYATALLYGATLWTQDADFKDLPNVKFFAKT